MNARAGRLDRVVLGGLLLASAGIALAQGYPARQVRVVVAYPPGGTNDIVARPVAAQLSEILGQSFVVDNRGGASGNIGTEQAAKSSPDGYTLLMAAGAVTIAPSIYKSLPYDIVKDFVHISLAARGGFVLLLHPTVPAKSVKDFISLAKSRKYPLNCASAGAGAPPFLAAMLFQTMTGTTFVDVPYKGGTQPLTDLVGGQVDIYFGGIASAAPYMQGGRIRALAVTTLKRSQMMPDVPTFDESGLKGFDISTWFGLMAPAGTPADIVNRLHGAMVKAVAAPAVRDTMLAAGLVPETSTPTQFSAHVREEIKKFGAIVKASGAKLE